MSNCSILADYDDRTDRTFVFAIVGNAVPYKPASMYGGPDNLGWEATGGTVDVDSVRLESIKVYGRTYTEFSRQNRDAVEGAFSKLLHSNQTLRDQVTEQLWQDAESRRGDDRSDELRDRAIERKAEARQ